MKGQVVLITGASRGIGAVTAKAFASRGARVLLLARTAPALEQLADEIRRAGGWAKAYVGDLSDREVVDHIVEEIKAEFGAPDIIINNAGTGSWLFTEETSDDEMIAMMAVPYFAAFTITRAFLPEMLNKNHGHILNVTSAAAFRPIPGATAYNAACWAIRGFTEALRADLRGTGIGVTLLALGTVTTPGFDHYPGVVERMPRILKIVPVLTPEQVAEAIIHGVERKKSGVVIPFMMKLLVIIDRIMPAVTGWLIFKTGWKH